MPTNINIPGMPPISIPPLTSMPGKCQEKCKKNGGVFQYRTKCHFKNQKSKIGVRSFPIALHFDRWLVSLLYLSAKFQNHINVTETSIKYESKSCYIDWIKCNWKCGLQNIGHFISASMCQGLSTIVDNSWCYVHLHLFKLDLVCTLWDTVMNVGLLLIGSLGTKVLEIYMKMLSAKWWLFSFTLNKLRPTP